ncbi:serine hydrolase [Azorhizobium oxalatiphilum]|uniref:Serine hydrolase n=1 Tax=Azorhizobium oxalatiphilum TaxID=980631 RepID=A0A917FFT6_9HYPH|nr:serine hydrolase [Azorhizobium oxalatiphilum]GGF75107.1 serine hydrolase [Azorhizobium oxalatiphilum]
MMSSGLSRRTFSGALLTGLAAPALARAADAPADAVRDAIRHLDQLHTLQVQRGDAVVVAQVRRGPGLARPANIKSCSKSLVALLLGTAIARGEIGDVHARLADVAPRLIPGDATAGVGDLTMEDLVTLRAGLARTSGPGYGGFVSASNWVSYVLTRPMEDQPGGRMLYSTGTTHVLGAVLATVTGKSLLTLARERLAPAVGETFGPWTQDPQGFYLGGNDMALTPRAMLRLAVLMRDGGRHDGRELLPADWLKASLTPRTQSPYSGLSYGYGWFLSPSGYVIARGYGGQIIAAHAERRIAVAITSDTGRPARSEGYFGDLMQLLDGPVLELA